MPAPYLSEIKYLGAGSQDFVEVAVPTGTDVADIFVTIYHPSGNVRSVNALGSPVATQFGHDIYVISTSTSGTFTGLHKKGAVALEQNGNLVSFVSFDDGAPVTANGGIANGQTSTQIGQAGSGASLETTDGGATYTTQTAPNSGAIPCLCAGTSVLTAAGPRSVEDLKPGDLVCLADGALIPLRLVLKRPVSAREMARNPKLRPVVIPAGALGPGCPESELRVSRQHRFLVQSPIAERMTGARSVLVSAAHLVQMPGIGLDGQPHDTVYVHLLFDRHVLILANGAVAESLLVAPGALDALDDAARARIRTMFPKLNGATSVPCCPIPPGNRQKRLIERHVKNRKPLVPAACDFPAVEKSRKTVCNSLVPAR